MVLEGGVYHIMETIKKQEACGLVFSDMNYPNSWSISKPERMEQAASESMHCYRIR
jgi:hypothetical protein